MRQEAKTVCKHLSMLMVVLMTFFVLSGLKNGSKVLAAELTAGLDGIYHLSESGDYTLTVNSSMAGSSNWIKLTVIADTEGNLTYPYDTYGGIDQKKHLSKDEEFEIRLDMSGYNNKTITLKFEAVHTHDWDSATGKCKICGEACTHDFSGGHAWCDTCKWTCTHEKKTVTNYYNNYNEKHKVIGKCDVCGKTELEMGEEDCVWEMQSSNKSWNSSDGSLKSHEYVCSKCKQTKNENCSFDTVISITKSGPETHTIKTKCKCGNTLTSNNVSHKWSGNKCTECGFVRVQPGKVKGFKLKKIKSVKKKRWQKGYWDSSNKWHKGFYYTYYRTTYKVTFSKVKNAKYYNITYDSDVFIYNPETTKKIKSGAKITMNLAKKGNTYITLNAVSKTGNKSTYKKNFKYKIK